MPEISLTSYMPFLNIWRLCCTEASCSFKVVKKKKNTSARMCTIHCDSKRWIYVVSCILICWTLHTWVFWITFEIIIIAKELLATAHMYVHSSRATMYIMCKQRNVFFFFAGKITFTDIAFLVEIKILLMGHIKFARNCGRINNCRKMFPEL